MSDDLNSICKDQKPQSHKGDSNKKSDDGVPDLPSIIHAPPKNDSPGHEKSGLYNKLKDGLEALAFVFIILTFWEMRSTQIIDQRAWVSVHDPAITMPYSPTNPVGISVQIANTGKTPAKIISIQVLAGISVAPFTVTNWILNRIGGSGEFMAPGASYGSVVRETNAIGVEGFKLMNERNAKHCFIYKIIYRDVFRGILGHDRHTDAGFILEGTLGNMSSGAIIAPCGTPRMD